MSSTDWRLGQTSERYESGGRGAGTISTGAGDRGGVSYGTYQLSSKMGTLQEYLDSSPYGRHFEGLTPTSREFNDKWRELARTDPGFAQDQHDFIKKTHYDVQVEKLEKAGIDLSDRGPAVQDALWSTSVQFRDMTRGIVSRGLEEKFGKNYDLSKLSDREIVEAIQDYKINHNEQLFRSSPKLWDSLENRARSEKAALVDLAERDIQHDRGTVKAPKGESQQVEKPSESALLKEGTEGPRVRDLQAQLSALGYTGKDGKPLTADGEFGANTRHAVEAFQKAHGLDVDGKAGKTTLAELASAKTHPLVSEATHANHGLYTAIGQQLPAGTKADVVANVTLQALENGIAKPSDIRGLVVRGNDVIVVGQTPGFNAKVDLAAPTADLQAMSDHMAGQSRQAQQDQTAQRTQEPVL